MSASVVTVLCKNIIIYITYIRAKTAEMTIARLASALLLIIAKAKYSDKSTMHC